MVGVVSSRIGELHRHNRLGRFDHFQDVLYLISESCGRLRLLIDVRRGNVARGATRARQRAEIAQAGARVTKQLLDRSGPILRRAWRRCVCSMANYLAIVCRNGSGGNVERCRVRLDSSGWILSWPRNASVRKAGQFFGESASSADLFAESPMGLSSTALYRDDIRGCFAGLIEQSTQIAH